jgi:hypothetical protein
MIGSYDRPASRVIQSGWSCVEKVLPGRIKLQPESVMADVCLGVTVTGLYTLVAMGLIIVFM